MLSAPKILPTKWALLLSNLPVNNFLQSTMSQGQVSIHFTKCVNTDCTMSVKAVSLTLTPSLHLAECPPCSLNIQGSFNLSQGLCSCHLCPRHYFTPDTCAHHFLTHFQSYLGRWPFLTYIYKGIFNFPALPFPMAVISGLLSPVCLSLSEYRQRTFSRRFV